MGAVSSTLTSGGNAIIRPIEDAFETGFNKFEDSLKTFFTKTLNDVIWQPINRALIQPSIQFFETVIMYIQCSIDKIQNFWGCFFWYVIFIIQETLHGIITGILSLIQIITRIDLLPLYYYGLDLYGYISDIFHSYTGTQLFIFPYSDEINKKCFVCRVEKSAPTVSYQDTIQNMREDLYNQVSGQFQQQQQQQQTGETQ